MIKVHLPVAETLASSSTRSNVVDTNCRGRGVIFDVVSLVTPPSRVISGDSSHFLEHFSRLMCHIIHGLIAPPRVLYKYGPVSLQ